MQRLAAELAREVHAGDVYLLYGAVGAGKSAFSRAFIRAAAGDPYLTVPSPTFLLQQVYEDHPGAPIHHFDLYRLEPGSDMGRLDLEASFRGAACLVEWPERLAAGHAPPQRLELWIEIIGEAEQQRIQEAWRRADSSGSGARTAGNGAAAGAEAAAAGAGPSSGGAAASGGASTSGDGGSGWEPSDGSDEDDEDDPYTDRRWRRVRAVAFGSGWGARLSALSEAAAAGGLSGRVRAGGAAVAGEACGAAAVEGR